MVVLVSIFFWADSSINNIQARYRIAGPTSSYSSGISKGSACAEDCSMVFYTRAEYLVRFLVVSTGGCRISKKYRRRKLWIGCRSCPTPDFRKFSSACVCVCVRVDGIFKRHWTNLDSLKTRVDIRRIRRACPDHQFRPRSSGSRTRPKFEKSPTSVAMEFGSCDFCFTWLSSLYRWE